MLDRTIPFYNTILRCDHYQAKDTALPNGYSVVTYKPGYEKAWAERERFTWVTGSTFMNVEIQQIHLLRIYSLMIHLVE